MTTDTFTSKAPTVMITGAAGLVGSEISQRLARKNWRVIPCGFRSEGTLSTSNTPSSTDFQIEKFDLRCSMEVENAVKRILAKFGCPFGLVHCAGPIRYDDLQAASPEVWQEMIEGNLYTAVNLIRCLIPHMKRERQGRILILGFSGIGSGLGFRRIVAYAGAKEALGVFARSVALDTAPYGITVNMVSPGIIVPAGREPSAIELSMLKRIPLGKFGQTTDISATVEWLLGDSAEYITGQNIKVSGGLHI